MAKYTVAFKTGAYSYIEVEADSPEEARDVADEEFVAPYLCAQCSGWGQPDRNMELGDDWQQDETDGGVWIS